VEEVNMEPALWGFYSVEQRKITERLNDFKFGARRTPTVNVYARTDGSEAEVTMVDAVRARLEATWARYPDAGPIIPLTHWIRYA
jgi:hypothetical protein